MSSLLENIGALIPSVGVLIAFVVVIRAILGADRRERTLRAQEEKEVARKVAE